MSSGSSQIIKNYQFSAANKQIVFLDYKTVSLSGIKLITNVTTGAIIFQFNSATLNGSVSGNVLTLTFNTSAMSNTDILAIIYEDPRSESDSTSIINELKKQSAFTEDAAREDTLLDIAQMIDARMPSMGQRDSALSMPVTIASDQAPLAMKQISTFFTASGQTLILSGLEGYSTVAIDVGDSSFSQTVTFDIWYKDSGTWQSLTLFNPFLQANSAALLSGTTSQMPVRAVASIVGASQVRVTCSSFGGTNNKATIKAYQLPSSTVQIGGGVLNTVNIVSSVTSIASSVTPGTAAGNLGKARATAVGATDTLVGSGYRKATTLAASAPATGAFDVPITNDFGSTIIKPEMQHKRTYSTSFNVASAALATDIGIIIGSSSTTVEVTKIIISGIQTTGGVVEFLLQKRSADNTGGTSTTPTLVPHDSNDAAATAVVRAYTVNPTTGALVGTIRRDFVSISGATGTTHDLQVYDFGAMGRPITLRGVAQALAINLNGVTVTGSSLDIAIEFTEF